MALLNQTAVSIKEGSGEWTVLPACYEIPDLGVDPEGVDTTTLDDRNMTEEQGIGDPGTLTFGFRYREGADQAYEILEGMKDSTDLEMKVAFKAGIEVTWATSGIATKLLGGGVNDVLNFELSSSISGEFVTSKGA